MINYRFVIWRGLTIIWEVICFMFATRFQMLPNFCPKSVGRNWAEVGQKLKLSHVYYCKCCSILYIFLRTRDTGHASRHCHVGNGALRRRDEDIFRNWSSWRIHKPRIRRRSSKINHRATRLDIANNYSLKCVARHIMFIIRSSDPKNIKLPKIA